MIEPTISSRGVKASSTVMRVDLEISMEAQQNQYDAVNNPNGSFPLNIAENRLSWSTLKSKFKSICSQHDVDDWALGYTAPSGAPQFKEAVAEFYQRFFSQGSVIDPMSLAVSPGATGIIEMTALLLCEAGDTAAMPAPCYPVYSQDLENISGVLRHDIITHLSLPELHHGPLVNLAHLEKTKSDIEAKGSRFKMLIITTPDNPTGITYSMQHLKEMAHWCEKNKVHLIVNEIYALSIINSNHDEIARDYPEVTGYESILPYMAEQKSDYLHHWYSFSKDFGISGFRVGIIHSHNAQLIKAFENYNLSHSVSNHTQWLLMHLLKDQSFLQNYITTNQQELTESYVEVIKVCRKFNIPYVPSRGGLFAWIDLHQYLEQDTAEAEMKLWMSIFNETGILLTPGMGFGHLGHGKFRVVYPYISLIHLKIAMGKLSHFFEAHV